MVGDLYKHTMRVRVCGLLIRDGKILLVQLKSPVTNTLVWIPPGGGLQFGEKMHDGLQREFREETGLEVAPNRLIAVNELVEPPFHAVECYFSVQKTGGKLILGKDPEQADKDQIIKDVQWVAIEALDTIPTAPDHLKEWAEKSHKAPCFYFT